MTKPEDCNPCTPGFYCAGSNNPAPSGPCNAGYYCDGGAQTPTAKIVPQGHFSSSGASAATPCLPGTYQGAQGQASCNPCLEGYYCALHGTITPVKCTAGNYCPTGASTPQPCPLGTFSNTLQLLKDTDCTACSPGFYCDSTGRTTVTGQCDAGYVCTGGSKEKAPVGKSYGDLCPAGHYCPAGTHTPIKCPIGKYSSDKGNTNSNQCLPCPPGYFCSSQGLAAASGKCKGGYYCISGSSTDSPVDGVTGNECPIGHYCPSGSSAPVKCADGSYMPSKQAAACTPCPAGSYCIDQINPVDCPASYFCPEGTGAIGLPVLREHIVIQKNSLQKVNVRNAIQENIALLLTQLQLLGTALLVIFAQLASTHQHQMEAQIQEMVDHVQKDITVA